ncbi:MAG: ParB/RepB/Spo0J family partition protein, partial [Actinomycetota bacterium]
MAPVSRERRLEWIPIDKIIPNDRNPRQAAQFTPEKLQELRTSMNRHGILQPVTVVRYGNGMFKLTDGERRYQTAKLEDIKEIPAIILDSTGGTDEVVLMYNIHHLQKGWEMAESLLAIKDIVAHNPDRSLEDLASELGMSIAT